MIIFNDLQTLLSGGLGRYSFELSKELYFKEINNIKLIIRKEDRHLFDFAKDNDLIIADNIDNSIKRNYYEQFILPHIINKKYPNAIYHNPDIMLPILLKNHSVITVHDMAFRTIRGSFTRKSTLWKNKILDISIKKANQVIAITNFTKGELIKYYPQYKDKIKVIYNGFNNFSDEDINLSNINNNILNLNHYLLTVSTISPRKNVDGLIKAFNLIKDKIDYKLVIAGKKGWLYDKVFDIVNKMNLNNRVIFTDKINDDELKYLYKNSD